MVDTVSWIFGVFLEPTIENAFMFLCDSALMLSAHEVYQISYDNDQLRSVEALVWPRDGEQVASPLRVGDSYDLPVS